MNVVNVGTHSPLNIHLLHVYLRFIRIVHKEPFCYKAFTILIEPASLYWFLITFQWKERSTCPFMFPYTLVSKCGLLNTQFVTFTRTCNEQYSVNLKTKIIILIPFQFISLSNFKHFALKKKKIIIFLFWSVNNCNSIGISYLNHIKHLYLKK